MEGDRGRYYDQAGALRDMVQNHLLQVLALVAMEAPNSLSPEDVRSEKVRALAALTRFTAEEVAQDVVRGRYTSSSARGLGYLEEQGVAADSTTETYVAIRAGIHNWRWNGVPFFLRTGKCLFKRKTEVILRFRTPPVDLLNGPAAAAACALRPNALHLMIQPTEGVRLGFLVKEPGPGLRMRQATLGFDYSGFGLPPTAPAYQRLLLDAIEGNATLFIRGDETETAWAFADAIRAGWEAEAPPVYEYPAGTYGPPEADDLFRGCEGTWGRGGVGSDLEPVEIT
jgi:glucose-6-phosphate 1-dehydrogenase